MGVVSVHYRGYKKTLEPIPRVLARGDQALQILGRYKARLDGVSGALSALEVEDLVTVRDVATVLQRAEMVRRIAKEIEGYVVELGVDGRLVELQLEELTGGVRADRRLVCKDYFIESSEWVLEQVTNRLGGAHRRGAARPALRRGPVAPRRPTWTSTRRSSRAATACSARSRACPKRSPRTSCNASAQLPKIMRASISDLVEVEGVGEARARAIKDGLSRVAETSILDRYA